MVCFVPDSVAAPIVQTLSILPGTYSETSALSFPAEPTTTIPLSIAFCISASRTPVPEVFLEYIDKLMIFTFELIAYSIPAITDDIEP